VRRAGRRRDRAGRRRDIAGRTKGGRRSGLRNNGASTTTNKGVRVVIVSRCPSSHLDLVLQQGLQRPEEGLADARDLDRAAVWRELQRAVPSPVERCEVGFGRAERARDGELAALARDGDARRHFDGRDVEQSRCCCSPGGRRGSRCSSSERRSSPAARRGRGCCSGSGDDRHFLPSSSSSILRSRKKNQAAELQKRRKRKEKNTCLEFQSTSLPSSKASYPAHALASRSLLRVLSIRTRLPPRSERDECCSTEAAAASRASSLPSSLSENNAAEQAYRRRGLRGQCCRGRLQRRAPVGRGREQEEPG